MKEESVTQPFHTTEKFHSGIDGYMDRKLSDTDTNGVLVRDSDNNITKENGQLVAILEPCHLSAVLKARDEMSTLKPDSVSLKSNSQSETGSTDYKRSKSDSDSQSADSTGLTEVHKVETSLVNGCQRKVITLRKDTEPLGATVRSEGNSIVVARIIEGGMADRTKLLRPGDEILEVNGTDIHGHTVDQVADLMMSLTGDVKIVTQVATSAHIGASQRHVLRRKITVRAQFDYDVREDSFIPCVELGLSFQIGDILHIINRDDPHWWQARREDDEPNSLAGLIPSRLFWETREEVRRAILAESDASIKKKNGKSFCCHSIKKKRNRKKMASKGDVPSADLETILTYEEVGVYGPLPDRKRPIVIVGCEELRLHKLCEKMVALDKDRFSQPIKTSSRLTMFAAEDHKAQLQYLPLEKFIEKIKAGEFVEYKVADEPELHYVGINKKSVREVIDKGVTCIMHCQPKNINRIRTEEFKPYIVFVAAPPIQRLRTVLRSESTIEPTNDECKHIIDLSRHNESTYSYLYDYVMTVRDAEQACEELLAQINLLEEEEQWVPIGWLPEADGITNSNYINRQSGDSAVRERTEDSNSTKHSVIADVEPEPSSPSAVVARAGRDRQMEVKSLRVSSVEDGPTGDNVQLITVDKANQVVVGADKWVEFL